MLNQLIRCNPGARHAQASVQAHYTGEKYSICFALWYRQLCPGVAALLTFCLFMAWHLMSLQAKGAHRDRTRGHVLVSLHLSLKSIPALCTHINAAPLLQTMGLHTWGIYKDGSADRHNLLGQVRKVSSTRADITLEKTPQNSYTAEGNLADMAYVIKKGNQPAAQVHSQR